MTHEFDNIHDVTIYQGDNIELLTLAAWSPDVLWIANTLARRWESGVCICGCNSGEGDETTIINEGCVEGFKKRLSILSESKAAEWGEWLDEFRWSEGLIGETHMYLRELQCDLWRAENREAIQRTHATIEARLAETQATVESLASKAERFKELDEAFTGGVVVVG